MNLIGCLLLLWLSLDQFNFILCAYKKKKNEHCSLQVNSICYDDELNDNPIKIVHDENGVKSVIDQSENKRKNRKKFSTDVLQPKISWDQHFKPKLKFFGYPSGIFNSIVPTTTTIAPLERSQTNQPKLIFKYHKINDPLQSEASAILPTILPTNLFTRFPSLNSPTNNFIKPTINPVSQFDHLKKFKTVNQPLFASSSFINNSPFLSKSYPIVSPFVSNLHNDNYDKMLFTDKSVTSTNGDDITSPKNLNKSALKTTTSPNIDYLISSSLDTLIRPLPTNLTNYINLRESGKLKEYMENEQNTTQDRNWSSSDEDVFPTFSTKTTSFNLNNNSLESDDDLTFNVPKMNSQEDASSTSSKEIDTSSYKLANQFSNNEFEKTVNNYLDFNSNNNPSYFSTTSSSFENANKDLNDSSLEQSSDIGNSKEMFASEKFKSIQPLSIQQHAEWPSSSLDTTLDTNHHHIDELLANNNHNVKSAINYLTEDEQHMKNNFNEQNSNYPIFYPVKNMNAAYHPNPHKPTYTIVQLKDKNFERFKKYAKLLKKVAVEEAKKFKKNELDTFLKRKKLIIDRYKPNDMYQKAIAAKYVWKKVGLDFLSLLGYQIANYLGPLNSKHWKFHSNLISEEDKNSDQFKAIEHILKNQNHYYQQTASPQFNKYIFDQAFSDDFSHHPKPLPEQFLNDDTFFNQNYFKFKDKDSLLSNEESKFSQEDFSPLNTVNNFNNVDNFNSNSNQEYHGSLLDKEKELNQQFFQNQELNNKLLNQQLVTDGVIDFRTKEDLLDKVIKPIKITQQ